MEFDDEIIKFMIEKVDEYLVATGSQSLLDADKIRDQFLDLRSFMSSLITPEVAPADAA